MLLNDNAMCALLTGALLLERDKHHGVLPAGRLVHLLVLIDQRHVGRRRSGRNGFEKAADSR